MKTMVEMKDREALVGHCRSLVEQQGYGFDDAKLFIKMYDARPDAVTGWRQTYAVILRGLGVVGFINTMF